MRQVPTGDRMLAERVRERRQALGLSQAMLAQLVSAALPAGERIGQTYVSQIEGGKIGTTLPKLRALAEALGTTVAYLIGEADKAARTRPQPRRLGIADSGRSDTARRSGEQRPEPREWR